MTNSTSFYSPIERALIATAARCFRDKTADDIFNVLESNTDEARDARASLKKLSDHVLERAFTLVAHATCRTLSLEIRVGADSKHLKNAHFLSEKSNLGVLMAAFLQICGMTGLLQSAREQEDLRIGIIARGWLNNPFIEISNLPPSVPSYAQGHAQNVIAKANHRNIKYE